jgi:MFS family permease
MTAAPRAVRGMSVWRDTLASRSFRALWIGQNASRLGNAIQEIAIAWTSYRLTGSSAWMGVILAASAAAQVVFTLVGGVIGDRHSRRTVLLWTDACSAAVVTTLAILTAAGLASAWLLLGAAILLGITSAFSYPALGPLIADCVPAERLLTANALDDAAFSLVLVVGPALGGVLVASVGAAVAFAFNAVTFATGFLFTTMVRAGAPGPPMTQASAAAFREGLRYWRSSGWLRWTLLFSALASALAIAPWLVLLPGLIQARTPDTLYYGAAIAAQGAGCLIGTVAAGQIGDRVLRGTPFCLIACLLGLGGVIAGTISDPPVFIVAGLLFGAGTTTTVIGRTLIQRLCPPGLRSRIISLLMFTTVAIMPVCYAAVGFIASRAGFAITLAAGGAAFTVASLAAIAFPSVRQIGAELLETGGTP